MKDISNMLSRGNLTPREKFLLLIKNDVNKSKTGKETLTAADKEALENWKAQNNAEAHEWNQLNDGWKYGGRMEIEAEFIYKDAQVAYLGQLPIILKLLQYSSHRQMGRSINALKQIKKVTVEEALEITQKQKDIKLKDGLDFDYAVYQFAFELMSETDKKKMKDLYADIEFDHQYLDQEEIIAKLFGGRKELTDEAKEKLAHLVSEQSYNKFAKEHQLFHYFACIPLLEVAKYFLKKHGIEIGGVKMLKNQEAQDGDLETCEDVTKTMKKYAEDHDTTIKNMLYEGCLGWLDHGLLDNYRPLAISNHATLLERWFETKIKAKKILLGHIKSGELKLRERTDDETRKDKMYSKNLCDAELEAARMILENLDMEKITGGELDEKPAFEIFSDRVITGESLYSFSKDYEFAKDFKERADKYDANLGIVYADDDPEHRGEHLDQELLICDTTDKGEASVFSLYGMHLRILEGVFKGKAFFDEYTEDGQKFLKFKDMTTEVLFLERRKDLINGYASLLGFEMVFKKLSPIYEVDMTSHVSERLQMIRTYIQQYNDAVRAGTNTDEELKKKQTGFWREKDTLQFKEEIVIDVDHIKPDQKIIDEHTEKVREIFPDF